MISNPHEVPELAPSWRYKFARANEHIEALIDDFEDFLRSPDAANVPFGVQLEEETGDHVVRVAWLPDMREREAQWAAIIGDYLFDLRSALDQAFYALCLLDLGGTDPSDWTQFPIITSKREWQRNRVRLAMNQLTFEHRKVIKRIQPKERWNDERPFIALARLEALHLVDKHRAPNLVIMAPRISEMVPVSHEPEIIVSDIRPGPDLGKPLHLHAELVRYRLTITSNQPQVYIHHQEFAAPHIGFEDGSPVLYTLLDIGRAVARAFMLIEELLEVGGR